MMHLDKYYFIDKFKPNHIKKLDKNISLIYRNYKSPLDLNLIRKIRDFCKKNKIKFFLSNNIKIALKLGLDGAYIPSFNKGLTHLNYCMKKKFILLGSAHNLYELRIKEQQNVSLFFISSLFKKYEKYLGLYKFIYLSKFTKKKVVALGGINKNNLKKLSMLRVQGFAAIRFFE